MLLFKDRNNEMASEPARGDGSRTRRFFQQGKWAHSPASLLLQQLAGYSDHHAVGKWGLEAMACELAEHLVDCQAVILPHMVQQAQSMILCRERERHKPTVGSFPFCPLCCPEVPGWAPAICSMPSCCWVFPWWRWVSYLHHDIVTGSCLLSLIHPALYYIITGLQQVLKEMKPQQPMRWGWRKLWELQLILRSNEPSPWVCCSSNL